jgi:hypothetical protein
MAADCKSATLRVTEVRILPCAPLVLYDSLQKVAVTGDCCGSKPGRQRKDGYCAGRTGIAGGFSLADDGARQTSIADMDIVRIFCIPRHTRTAAFAVGCKEEFVECFESFRLCCKKAGVAQW